MTTPRIHIPTNTLTRYEVALMRGGETLYVLGYTERKSLIGVAKLLDANTYDMTSLLTDEELDTLYDPMKKVKGGFQVGPSLFIRFTGRTERTASTLMYG